MHDLASNPMVQIFDELSQLAGGGRDDDFVARPFKASAVMLVVPIQIQLFHVDGVIVNTTVCRRVICDTAISHRSSGEGGVGVYYPVVGASLGFPVEHDKSQGGQVVHDYRVARTRQHEHDRAVTKIDSLPVVCDQHRERYDVDGSIRRVCRFRT